MVDFARKRLQVFVSSTFSDLIPERQAAVEAILTAGHIPAGMELFTSGDESQMEVIKQWIIESDVYLLILGGRYGSIEPISGKSYTQIEYEYALEMKRPLFACVIQDSAIESRGKVHGRQVIEQDNPQKLKDFRDLVLSKTSRFWDDPKDIKITVGETLAQLSRREDLIGWIRPTGQANMPALADEIARLSKENATLRVQVAHPPVTTYTGLTYDEMVQVLGNRELLDWLAEFRSKDSSELPHSVASELIRLGIVKRPQAYSIGFSQYESVELTDVGRMFLNRHEVELIRQKAQEAK